jgi:small multidrug resistance pump
MSVEPAGARRPRSSALDSYRPWLVAAAAYNLVTGATVVLAPSLYFRIVHMPPPNYLPLWQVVGMFVLVYSPGYWWASRDPVAHSHLVLIGLLGKILGPIGFAWSAWTGQLPITFGAILITNDLLWWPAFVTFVVKAARLSGGWRLYLFGRLP